MERALSPLVTTSYYEIVLYPQDKILGLYWRQPPSPEEYKKGTTCFLEALHQYQVKKIIFNSSHRGNPMPEDLIWLTHQVVPVLCEEAVQQLAFVVPEDPFHARHLENCLMDSEVCYELQFFYSCAEAFAWLRNGLTQGQAVA